MIYLLIYFISWLLAGFFNAVMDAIDLHPITNTFPKIKFYQMAWSGWTFDCWHISKFTMQVLFAGSGFLLYLSATIWWPGILFTIGISGKGFALVHNIFFHHIFLKKEQ
jgi:hypothetical protein